MDEFINGLLKTIGLVAMVFTPAEAFLLSKTPAKISCLMSDVKVPGIGGLEFKRQLVARNHLFPVILISAFDHESLRKLLQTSGAVGLLSKPFREKDLLGFVRSARSRPCD